MVSGKCGPLSYYLRLHAFLHEVAGEATGLPRIKPVPGGWSHGTTRPPALCRWPEETVNHRVARTFIPHPPLPSVIDHTSIRPRRGRDGHHPALLHGEVRPRRPVRPAGPPGLPAAA